MSDLETTKIPIFTMKRITSEIEVWSVKICREDGAVRTFCYTAPIGINDMRRFATTIMNKHWNNAILISTECVGRMYE